MKRVSRTDRSAITSASTGSRKRLVGAGIGLTVLAGMFVAPSSVSAAEVREADSPISTQGFHTSMFRVENNTTRSRLVQTSATTSTSFEEGGELPLDGTIILPITSKNYEVITDRTNGVTADISYDVVGPHGNTIGAAKLHMYVPAWGWNKVELSCQATGAVACTVLFGQFFMITDGSCPRCGGEPEQEESSFDATTPGILSSEGRS